MIVKRISDISCDVDAFNRSLPVYEEALKSKVDTRFSRSLLNAQQEGKNLDREEEKLYGLIPHITTGSPPTSEKPSSTFCGNTSHLQTGCIKYATKMSSNSATAAPPIWQTSSQLTIRGFLSSTMVNLNLNPLIADISRHAH